MDSLKIKKQGIAVTQKKADNCMLLTLFEHVEKVMNMAYPGNKQNMLEKRQQPSKRKREELCFFFFFRKISVDMSKPNT